MAPAARIGIAVMANVVTTARATAIGVRHRDEPARRTRCIGLRAPPKRTPFVSGHQQAELGDRRLGCAAGRRSRVRRRARRGGRRGRAARRGPRRSAAPRRRRRAAGAAVRGRRRRHRRRDRGSAGRRRAHAGRAPGPGRAAPSACCRRTARRSASCGSARMSKSLDQPTGVLAHASTLCEPVATEAVEILEDEVLLDAQVRDDAAAAVLGDPPEPGAEAPDGVGGGDVDAVDVDAAGSRLAASRTAPRPARSGRCR